MKCPLKHIAFFLLLGAGLGYWAGHSFRGGETGKICTKDSTVVLYDTLPYFDTLPVHIAPGTYQPPTGPVDSAAVVAAFHRKRPFTFSGESQKIRYTGKGLVFQNTIDSVQLRFQNFNPTVNEFYSYKPRENQLSAGILAGRNFAAPYLRYQRQGWELLAGYNLIQTTNQPLPQLFAGVGIKIHDW